MAWRGAPLRSGRGSRNRTHGAAPRHYKPDFPDQRSAPRVINARAKVAPHFVQLFLPDLCVGGDFQAPAFAADWKRMSGQSLTNNLWPRTGEPDEGRVPVTKLPRNSSQQIDSFFHTEFPVRAAPGGHLRRLPRPGIFHAAVRDSSTQTSRRTGLMIATPRILFAALRLFCGLYRRRPGGKAAASALRRDGKSNKQQHNHQENQPACLRARHAARKTIGTRPFAPQHSAQREFARIRET
jgi:hypothetical protein